MFKNKVINVKGVEKPKRNIPIIYIITFLSIFFITGLDFGFSKVLKKNIQFFASRFSCFLSILVMSSIFLQTVYKIDNGQLKTSLWLIYLLTQYTFHAISLRFSKYKLYNLIVDVHSVDSNTMRNTNKDTIIVNLFFFSIWNSIPVGVLVSYYFCTKAVIECDTIYVPGYLYYALIMLMSVVTVSQVLTYFHIRKASKCLNISLKDKNLDEDIKVVRRQFTAIADICDKISPIYGRSVSI